MLKENSPIQGKSFLFKYGNRPIKTKYHAKTAALFLLILSPLTYSKAVGETGTYIKDPNTYDYVKGVRLDSIDSQFAEFGKRQGPLFFDCGQEGNRKSMVITDKKRVAAFISWAKH